MTLKTDFCYIFSSRREIRSLFLRMKEHKSGGELSERAAAARQPAEPILDKGIPVDRSIASLLTEIRAQEPRSGKIPHKPGRTLGSNW